MTEKICIPKKIKTFQIVAGDAHICALTEYGVTCWGDDRKGQTDVPLDLQNPKQLAAYGNTTCAIVEGGIRCWGEDRSFLSNIPQFTRTPDQISLSVYQACAISDGKVICWDGRETYNYPVKNPRSVKAGGPNVSYSPIRNFLCAIGDNGLQCFNGQESIYQDSWKVEQMRDVTQISLSSASGCAVTSKGVECFTYNNAWIRDFPGLQPKGLAVGGWAWAITDDGLLGWGSAISGPPEYAFQGFSSIRQIALGGGQSCILYAGGVTCEGINNHGQLEVPDEL